MNLNNFKWNENKSTSINKKVISRGPDWFEKLGKINIVCHKITLECGHEQVYRHTGILMEYVECQKCKELKV